VSRHDHDEGGIRRERNTEQKRDQFYGSISSCEKTRPLGDY
jgi:hypothetical protein